MAVASSSEPAPTQLGLILTCRLLQAAVLPERGGEWQGMGKAAGPKSTSVSGFTLTSQRPRYLEIRAVMEQIPEIQKDSLDQFDCKLLNPSLQKAADKRRKDQFKRLIAGCIGVSHVLSSVLPTTLAVFLDQVFVFGQTKTSYSHWPLW